MPDQSSAASEHAIIQEITGPLKHLPDDPVALVHAEFPTAMRGYDRAAVDSYMRQMSQLVAELQATRSPEAAVRRALERVGEQISGILQRAHETAEQITAQSRREAEDRLEQARVEAAQIAGTAEQRVKELDGDTDRIWLERQRIVADAEDLAGQLVALAKSATERFPDDEEPEEPADQSEPYDGDNIPTVAGPPTFMDDSAAEDDEAEQAPPDRAGADQPRADREAPSPYAAGTEAAEATPYADAGDEEEDFFDEDEPETAFDDVEKTVAFHPLTPSERDAGSAGDAGAESHTGAEDDASSESAPGAEGDTGAEGDMDAEGEAGSEPGARGEAPRRPAPPLPPEADRPGAGPPPEGESTAIIPPASQAANRRRRF